jgi:hypothetical protein
MIIERFDIVFAIIALNRFSATLQEFYLELALCIFGYLKKYKDCCIGIDFCPILVDSDLEEFKTDFLDKYKN